MKKQSRTIYLKEKNLKSKPEEKFWTDGRVQYDFEGQSYAHNTKQELLHTFMHHGNSINFYFLFHCML